MLENFDLVKIDENEKYELFCHHHVSFCPAEAKSECLCNFYLRCKETSQEFLISETEENIFDKNLRPHTLKILFNMYLYKKCKIELIPIGKICEWEYNKANNDETKSQALKFLIFQEKFLKKIEKNSLNLISKLEILFKIIKIIIRKN